MDLGVHIRDGEFTATIYTLIKTQRFAVLRAKEAL